MNKRLINLVVLVFVILSVTLTVTVPRAGAVIGPGWYAGDCHSHTTYSDGNASPATMANAAKNKGLSYLIITDHNTMGAKAEIEAQTTESFIGICGDELTRSSKPYGHGNAFDVISHVSVNQTPKAMIDAVNANNNGKGFFYINHPCWSPWEWQDWTVSRFTGLEVWNAYYDGNWNESYNAAAFAKWDELNRAGMHLYGQANTDAHSTTEIGYAYNMTYVNQLTREEILNALRTGKFYGSNGPRLDFTVNGVMMGSDVVANGSTTVSVYLSATYASSPITMVKLIKNYKDSPIQTWTPQSNNWSTSVNVTVQPGDFLRMTVECADASRFAFSNPVFIISGSGATPTPTASPTSTPTVTVYGTPTVSPTSTATPTTGTLFYDDFNEHAAGTTPDGWSVSSKFTIANDVTSRYQFDGKGNYDIYSAAGSDWTTYAVEAVCKPVKFYSGSDYFGLAARYADAGNHYLFYYNKSTGNFRIGKFVGGVWTYIVGGPSYTVRTGSEYTLKFEVSGSTLRGYVNGVLQCSTTDSTFASGKIACYGNNIVVRFDNVKVL